MRGRYLSSKEACQALGVRSQTLYAYVSRGLIRSEPMGGKSRARRYHGEDVERLAQGKQLRKDPTRAARRALRTGDPVLESSLTLITEEALYYRGLDVLELARERSLEEVAALMWTGDAGAVETIRAKVLIESGFEGALPEGLSPLQQVQAVLPMAAALDSAAADLQPLSLYRVGWRILQLMTRAICGRNAAETGVGRALQQAWLPRRRKAARSLEAGLILCADHELNVSAFTARCVASSGANLYAVVSAALGALQGFRHGAAVQRLDGMWQEIEAVGDVRRAVVLRLERGDRIPGFGHAVYRGMDPRARVLLELVEETFPESDALRVAAELQQVVREVMELECNIDLALATLVRAAGLPSGSAIQLFALGRVVGWIAHALEQYATGELIRPRAAYVGVLPEESG